MRRLLSCDAAPQRSVRARTARAPPSCSTAGPGQSFSSHRLEDHRHRLFYAADRRFLGEQEPLEDALTEDPIQLMFTGRGVELRGAFDRLRQLAALRACPRRDFSVALTEYLTATSRWSMCPVGCSKGSAWLNGRPPRPCRGEVMAVGDNLKISKCSSSRARRSSWPMRSELEGAGLDSDVEQRRRGRGPGDRDVRLCRGVILKGGMRAETGNNRPIMPAGLRGACVPRSEAAHGHR